MKKIFITLSLVLFSSSAFADEFTCTVKDAELYPFDTLEFYQSGNTTYAEYYNGDYRSSAGCEGSHSGYECSSGDLEVTYYEDMGLAIVDSGHEEVEFDCP